MTLNIYALIFADSPHEAFQTAESEVFQPLIERGTFGNYRAGDELTGYPTSTDAETGVGKELVARGWSETVGHYQDAFEQIEELLEQHDINQFWNNGDVHRRYHYEFRKIGEFEGPHTLLYDEAGQGIRDREHLDNIYNHWEGLGDEDLENPFLERDLYVVPAEVSPHLGDSRER